MATALCEKCFQDWNNHELYCSAPLTPCEVCGVSDGLHNGGVRVNLFPTDPRAGGKAKAGNLVELPNNGFAPSNADIAKHLREQADWIESADAHPLRNVVLVLEYEDGILRRQTCGQPLDLARMTGLLFMAASRAAVGGVDSGGE